MSLFDFEESQFRNEINFCFIIFNYIFLVITFKKKSARLFRNQNVLEILSFID